MHLPFLNIDILYFLDLLSDWPLLSLIKVVCVTYILRNIPQLFCGLRRPCMRKCFPNHKVWSTPKCLLSDLNPAVFTAFYIRSVFLSLDLFFLVRKQIENLPNPACLNRTSATLQTEWLKSHVVSTKRRKSLRWNHQKKHKLTTGPRTAIGSCWLSLQSTHLGKLFDSYCLCCWSVSLYLREASSSLELSCPDMAKQLCDLGFISPRFMLLGIIYWKLKIRRN